MYLRHFARHTARRKYELMVRRLGKINEPFPVTPTGIVSWGCGGGVWASSLRDGFLAWYSTVPGSVMA
ncbi:hypothetical protein, partial [Streptomyces sp. NPDC004050]